jgi:hypothetical protein
MGVVLNQPPLDELVGILKGFFAFKDNFQLSAHNLAINENPCVTLRIMMQIGCCKQVWRIESWATFFLE